MFKKVIFIIGIILLVTLFVGATYTFNVSADKEKETYTLYSRDGRTMIATSEAHRDAQCTVGWSVTPPVTIYNQNNESLSVFVEEVDQYLNTGWYPEPVTKLYAADGREQYFLNSRVEAQCTVGWYKTYEEAHPINYDDIYLLARLINAEAAHNSTLDKQYVGAVVMNRLRMGYWGNTLKSVIYAKGQYACTWQGKKFHHRILGFRNGVGLQHHFSQAFQRALGFIETVPGRTGPLHGVKGEEQSRRNGHEISK